MDKVVVRKDLERKTAQNETLRLDVYYPPGFPSDSRSPAVIMVHGGPVGKGDSFKDWQTYVSWGQLIAASGMIAVVPNWQAGLIEDLNDVLRYVRDEANTLQIDKDRLCLFGESAGGSYPIDVAFSESHPPLRCIVGYYGVLDPLVARLQAGRYKKEVIAQSPPMLIANAGKDTIATGSKDFAKEATARGVKVQFLEHPNGLHGFDVRNDDDTSRDIIKQTLQFLKAQLIP